MARTRIAASRGINWNIITGTRDEDYNYDANGNLDLIQRNGTTLNLDHDTYNRIASLNSSTGEHTSTMGRATGLAKR